MREAAGDGETVLAGNSLGGVMRQKLTERKAATTGR